MSAAALPILASAVALIAAFLDMRLCKALPSIFGGVLIAGFLITGLTYGFTSIF